MLIPCTCCTALYSTHVDDLAIAATVKVNPGFLFPLPRAFCFVERPPMLIPHSDIRGYELARAGGSSVTFDLLLHLKAGGAPVEFSQLDRVELGRLQSYLEASKLKVGVCGMRSETCRCRP